MAELQKLVKKRGNIKAQLTRFDTYLSSISEQNIAQLPERLSKCEGLWDAFDNIQTEIEILDSSELQLVERTAFEETYFQISTQAKIILDKNVGSINNSSAQQGVKLPTIELPSFSGAYEHWLSFHDIFSSLVHNNKTLSDVQKFFYLKSALKSDAVEVIRSLEVSSDNYVVAWNLLKDRFENKKLIIHNHVRSLFELQPIVKESFIALRKLLDEIQKNLRALKSLKQPVENWDTLLIYLISTKLDNSTKREWESINISGSLPNMDTLIDFLTKRCNLLETLDSKNTNKISSNDTSSKIRSNSLKPTPSRSFIVSNLKCPTCNEAHFIYQCNKFLSMSPKAKIEEIKAHKLCFNCLRNNHLVQDCTGGNCKTCGKKHNTLLHEGRNYSAQDSDSQNTITRGNTNNLQNESTNKQKGTNSSHIDTNGRSDSNKSQTGSRAYASQNTASVSSVSTNCTHRQNSEVLLSTAMILITDKNGQPRECRALLDSASQSNFISRELSETLGLKTYRINLPVTGISQLCTTITHAANTNIHSKFNGFNIRVSFLILDKITENLPTTFVNVNELNIPENLTLADTNFGTPGKIDILLGASIFYDLLCVGQIKLGKDYPIMQKTKLGWVISGPLPVAVNNKNNRTVCNFIYSDLSEQLEKFWLLEECGTNSNLSKEERECQNIFMNSTTRDVTGRFIVSLPVRENLMDLGDSYQIALTRLNLLEKRFSKNPELKQQYIEFMTEYSELGHMSKINDTINVNQLQPIYYLPHHPVYKETSTTTKLRVVFDASAKSDTGISLNDTLRVGPTLQEDIFSILVRFRTHAYVLVADVAKMYRQVLVKEEQRDLQRILWRADSNQEVEHYRLNTVTYGTASAAFLAVRCLQQIGMDCQSKFPEASRSIISDFYVDDLLTGAGSTHDANQLKNDLIQILSDYGFTLRKWVSNHNEVLEDITDRLQNVTHVISDDRTTKTLGLLWNSDLDIFQYSVYQKNDRITKRFILSTISKIFDPLGLLGPVITKAKLILQKLWQLKIGWDEAVPMDLHTNWLQFYSQIEYINHINIPRQVLCSNAKRVELHCFADSSELAYGTCIYLRSTDSSNTHHVHLLCSKSRVSPLKTTSLPRLELCGALLAAQLADKVKRVINIHIHDVYFWCDSTIVLSWIATESRQLKTFIANRVSEIQQLTTIEQWGYINTLTNPADVISRGINPVQLRDETIWFQGPAHLSQDHESWPDRNFIKPRDLPEQRNITQSFVNLMSLNLFEKYS